MKVVCDGLGCLLVKQHKLVQLDYVSYKQFTEMQLKGRPMDGPAIIEKAKSFYGGMKIPDKCTFSESWLQNLGTAGSGTCPVLWVPD
jgi:hypothetical protein